MCKKSTKTVFARGKRKERPTVINWCDAHTYTLNNKKLLAMTADKALNQILEILLMFEKKTNRLELSI